ncbi:hypothetical protein GCU56_20485 [Geodermatophilus sabuli]|uniref:Uncharacterized protein n=1 Tax=Geodermatophilus sabuli TaxID=1564158 RepID=A0A7K3W5V3_9ACTN|nr:hypothetical protein [Geodermatophilus sabuli]NEK60239.1 hypothetical protein [Geodermatophilus sabuli]
MLELALLPAQGDVLEWQRRLADSLIEVEANADDIDPSDRKRHRHLLRVMADGLVHTLLDSHTIRALSQHRGKPPSIAGQGADFDFVFACARSLISSGQIPIVADLTTLIGVGDVVGISTSGVVVLECKNTTMPPRMSTSGRLARQRERGEQVESYLTNSRADEPDGTVKQAFDWSLPEPDFDVVRSLLARCVGSQSLVATHAFGEDDTLVAFTPDTPLDAIGAALPLGRTAVLPVIAFYSDLIEASSHRLWAPSSYPLPGEARLQLIEGHLRLMRCADLGALAAEFDSGGRRATLTPNRRSGAAQVTLDVPGFEPVTVTDQVISTCLYMPIAVASMRAALIEMAHRHVAQGASANSMTDLSPAEGDSFVYATVYRDDTLSGTPAE